MTTYSALQFKIDMALLQLEHAMDMIEHAASNPPLSKAEAGMLLFLNNMLHAYQQRLREICVDATPKVNH